MEVDNNFLGGTWPYPMRLGSILQNLAVWGQSMLLAVLRIRHISGWISQTAYFELAMKSKSTPLIKP